MRGRSQSKTEIMCAPSFSRAEARTRWLGCWAVLLVFVFALHGSDGAWAATGPSGRANIAAGATGDRAATRALLVAGYEFEKGVLARARVALVAESRTAEAIGHECKGVMRGAPVESVGEEEGPFASRPKLSGRVQGERARSEREKQIIGLEINETTFAAYNRVLRASLEAYVAATSRLSWSNPTIDALVGERTTEFREAIKGPSLAVCAEMRSWAASGFHVLPAGSKRLEEASEARSKQVAQGDLETLLESYEGRAERALVRRTAALKKRLAMEEDRDEQLLRAQQEMERALGEKPSGFVEQRLEPAIAKGRTSAGTTFAVRRVVGKSVLPRGCKTYPPATGLHQGSTESSVP